MMTISGIQHRGVGVCVYRAGWYSEPDTTYVEMGRAYLLRLVRRACTTSRLVLSKFPLNVYNV